MPLPYLVKFTSSMGSIQIAVGGKVYLGFTSWKQLYTPNGLKKNSLAKSNHQSRKSCHSLLWTFSRCSITRSLGSAFAQHYVFGRTGHFAIEFLGRLVWWSRYDSTTQPLLVLARYSGISKNAVEDTRRIHPLQAVDLTCCLDSDGVGTGIRRY